MNIIIDGNNLAHRCYWISEKQEEKLTTEDGINTGCVYVFLNSIKSLMKGFNTKNVYVCWDKKLTYPSINFRAELTKGSYKAQRDHKNLENLYAQIEIIENILPTLGIKNIYPNIMEGDDAIAYLAHNLVGQNVIISVDQDLIQLITPTTSFYDLNKKNIIDVNNFYKEIGIHLQDFVVYKAILGDKSDNIPGIPGYGKIKAKKLAEKWDIEKQNLVPEQVLLVENNLKLMDLTKGYSHYAAEIESYKQQLQQQANIIPNIELFKEHCKRYNFKSYLDTFSEWKSLFSQKSDLTALFQ